MANSLKPNPTIGQHPNENYARELLQLFTIGTVQLNLDGTNKLDAHGQPIPTYDQSQIEELARAFTGWTYLIPPGGTRGRPYFTGPMVPVQAWHDTGSKLIFGHQLPPDQTAEQDLASALDIIFEQPNVAPFVSLRLIQHLTTSNPSPAYIHRIANVFINNGAGVRGDLFAVVKAILLDPEARQGDDSITLQPRTGGHLREPVLYATALLRALNAKVTLDNTVWSWWLPLMGQKLLVAPSVFNYYSPFYEIPGTTLTGPEFQLLGSSSTVWRANFVDSLLNGQIEGVTTDLSPYVALADMPTKLVDAVDSVLMRGQMPSVMKSTILSALNATSNPATRATWPFI